MREQFAMPITDVGDGSLTVRVVPYGETINHGGRPMKFQPGSITVADGVPVSVDHGEGAMDRIGVLSSHASTDDGLYATLTLANTQLAQEVRELAMVGALTDVSAGVEMGKATKDSKGVHSLTGALDHVTITGRGAFGNAGAGSKILAVHSEDGSPTVDETTLTETVDDQSTEIETLTANVESLRATVAQLAVPGAVTETAPHEFADIKDFVLTFAQASKGNPMAAKRIENYVLADDTTTTAAGLVPDFYSTEIIGLIDNFRPYLGVIERDPIGSAGMEVKYPRRTQKPDVDVQSAEKTEVASQATTFDFLDVPLVTYAGASDVALQLIERSAPSFVTRLFAELAGVYAERTDAAAIAAAVTGAATQTAVLADLGADPAVTGAAVALGAGTIAKNTKRPATHMVVSVDKWAELLELSDSDGRPLILPGIDGPNNAQGGGDLSSFSFRYRGLTGVVDPQAADGTCLIMWDGATAYVEQDKQELRAVQVSLLGMDLGVFGLFAHVVKYPTGLYTITAA